MTSKGERSHKSPSLKAAEESIQPNAPDRAQVVRKPSAGAGTPQRAYSALSLRDLLDARDQYHIHLMRYPNVVATAIGYYRIRSSDPWPGQKGQKGEGPRLLGNSEVRPYSWPAILVFVERWADATEFSHNGTYDPDQMVPKTLYLPDGRRVPVCVIESPKNAVMPADPVSVRAPINNIGGGSPVIVKVQGREHVATIACLATDGHKTYALTNRHVSGEPGQILSSQLNGRTARIGVASEKQATRIAFSELYPGWSGRGTYINVDVGLIDIDDLTLWTAEVRGTGKIGRMIDLSSSEFSLSLIGRYVRGCGAASGVMEGEIHALFYRYKSRGGSEYVSDLFIGPRTPRPGLPPPPAFATRPGDSGTLWLLEPAPEDQNEFRALAMQWGENLLYAGTAADAQPYVLATCLSTVCDRLDLDLVRDWNLDQPNTWGAVGHFSIASRVASLLSEPKLKKLMEHHADIVSHDDDTILSSEFKKMGEDDFIPMADVPDFFWKHGKQGHTRGLEGPNHFADMDQKRPADGKDLLALCEDDENIDPNKWNAFYDTVNDLLDDAPIAQKHRGLLPFRVWQIFDEMARFARDDDTLPEFICAAGVLTHYVGDACQPLHTSYLHDGDPLQATVHTVHHRNGTTEDKKVPLGAGCHSAYEDFMVNAHRADILNGLDRTKSLSDNDKPIRSGFDAAKRTIALMRKCLAAVPPAEIVAAFASFEGSKKDLAEDLWGKFGKKTITCMQDGTHLLALLWQSAWLLGRTENAKPLDVKLSPEKAMTICASRTFLTSYSIEEIGVHLKGLERTPVGRAA